MAQNSNNYQQSSLDSRKIRETARNTAATLRAIEASEFYVLKTLTSLGDSYSSGGRYDSWKDTTSFVLTGVGDLMVIKHEFEIRTMPNIYTPSDRRENTAKHPMTDDEICMLDRRVDRRYSKTGSSEYFTDTLIAGIKGDGLLQCLKELVERTKAEAQRHAQIRQWVLAGLSSCHGVRIKGILNRKCSVCGSAQ